LRKGLKPLVFRSTPRMSREATTAAGFGSGLPHLRRAFGSMSKRSNRTLEIEQHVGSRIRQRRIMMGLTQQQLADLIGVTYQQAHKYERGINRVSAGRLFEIARVLGVMVGHFYEGLDQPEEKQITSRQRMSLELARNFALISNSKHQEALTHL